MGLAAVRHEVIRHIVKPRPEPKLRLVENAQTREPEKRRGRPHLSRPVKVTTNYGTELVFKSHASAWAQLHLPPNKIMRIAIAAAHSGSASISSGSISYTFAFVELV